MFASVSSSPKPFCKTISSVGHQWKTGFTHNVHRSIPSGGVLLQRPLPPHVLTVFTNRNKRVVSVLLDGQTQSVGNEGNAERLEVLHTLESADGLDRDPALSIAAGEGEEVFVYGQVGVGEVESD